MLRFAAMRDSLRAIVRSFVLLLPMYVACGPGGGGDHGELLSIEIEPADATLTFTGTPVSLGYKAIGTYEDGTKAELADAAFALDVAGAGLGELAGATFTASGQGAGKGGVIATRGTVSGATSVLVVVHRTEIGPGVPADGATKFPPDVAQPGPNSPAVVYPLDMAAMPTSVKAPVVQWEGDGAADHLYRVRVTTGHATVDTILAHAPDFTFSLQPTESLWQMIKNSNDGTVRITVEHWDATTGAQGSQPISVRMIPANITGAIYYWNLAAGRMERIDATGRGPAIANPPPKSDGNRCVACHTVSKDGRYLSGALWGGGLQGAVFDMADDSVKTADPAPTVTPLVEGATYTLLFSTFNENATRLMLNRGTGLEVIDPANGTSVATTGLPTSGVAHPSWSPDGKAVALVTDIKWGNDPAGWAVDYTRGDLAILSVTAPDTFAGPTTIVPAAAVDPAFAAPSWPTFAPDSKWIAYGAGVNSRGRNDAVPVVYPGALFVVDKDAGVPYRLDTACASQRDCYLPNFSPYDEGGYFWLVFYSTRDYGNAQAGTKDTQRRQLWVTAINKSKLGSGDPSSVPYWLPDQDVATQNMSAYWALPPPLQ
jgi:mono/diheme cytochrome c family protein